MADLTEVKRYGLISLTSTEIALIIASLTLSKKNCGLEGKKPVTIDGLKQDLIEAYVQVSGEPWVE